jgi:hypothetical protein
MVIQRHLKILAPVLLNYELRISADGIEIVFSKYLSIGRKVFDPLESISDESESMHWNQNFVLFPNMDLEMLCRFLFESTWGIFERSKQLVWTANKQVLLTPISPFATMLKIVGFSSFVGRTILYKRTEIVHFFRVDFALQAGITINVPTFSFGSQK